LFLCRNWTISIFLNLALGLFSPKLPFCGEPGISRRSFRFPLGSPPPPRRPQMARPAFLGLDRPHANFSGPLCYFFWAGQNPAGFFFFFFGLLVSPPPRKSFPPFRASGGVGAPGAPLDLKNPPSRRGVFFSRFKRSTRPPLCLRALFVSAAKKGFIGGKPFFLVFLSPPKKKHPRPRCPPGPPLGGPKIFPAPPPQVRGRPPGGWVVPEAPWAPPPVHKNRSPVGPRPPALFSKPNLFGPWLGPTLGPCSAANTPNSPTPF